MTCYALWEGAIGGSLTLKVNKNKGSGGVDEVTIEMFEKNVNINLREIQRLLQQERYELDPVRRLH